MDDTKFTNSRYEYLTREYAYSSKGTCKAPDEDELMAAGWNCTFRRTTLGGVYAVFERALDEVANG